MSLIAEEVFVNKIKGLLSDKEKREELLEIVQDGSTIVYFKKIPQAYGFSYNNPHEDEAIEDLAYTLYSAYIGLQDDFNMLGEGPKEDLRFIESLLGIVTK